MPWVSSWYRNAKIIILGCGICRLSNFRAFSGTELDSHIQRMPFPNKSLSLRGNKDIQKQTLALPTLDVSWFSCGDFCCYCLFVFITHDIQEMIQWDKAGLLRHGAGDLIFQ